MDTINKLELLKKNYIQIGGKGTIRRKKIKKTIKPNKLYLDKIKKLGKDINDLPKDINNKQIVDDYLNIFHKNILNNIKKEDKTKIKKSINDIKNELSVYFTNINYDNTFYNLCQKNLKDGALNSIYKYLECIFEILSDNEYLNYNNNYDDIIIDDAIYHYKLNKTDIPRISPLTLRNCYKKDLTDTSDKELSKKYYFKLLKSM